MARKGLLLARFETALRSLSLAAARPLSGLQPALLVTLAPAPVRSLRAQAIAAPRRSRAPPPA